jgi:hypothetical protein
MKKEENSDPQYNMNESWLYCAKWNKPGTKWQILNEYYHLHEVNKVVKMIEIQNKMVATKDCGRMEEWAITV